MNWYLSSHSTMHRCCTFSHVLLKDKRVYMFRYKLLEMTAKSDQKKNSEDQTLVMTLGGMIN